MKRSELVKLIMDTVNKTQYQDYEISEDVAERVLRTIEEVGMSPPFTIVKEERWENIYTDDGEVLGKVKRGAISYRGWEPEN